MSRKGANVGSRARCSHWRLLATEKRRESRSVGDRATPRRIAVGTDEHSECVHLAQPAVRHPDDGL